MTILERIKKIEAEDYDIGLNYGHYKPLAELIESHGFYRAIEIGCAYANLSKFLLENTNLSLLYSIDPYLSYDQMPGVSSQDDYDMLHFYVLDKMDQYFDTGFCFHRQTSKSFYEYANKFLYNGIDIIFIDGNHTYEDVSWEIENYSTIIRPGGILSGHDITVFEGVDRAVHEYAQKTGKELKTLPGNIWYFEM